MAEKKLKLTRIPKTDKKSENMEKAQWKPDNRPSIYFNSEQLPEIKTWSVGKKYKLVVEVEMMSASTHENKEGKSTNADFKIDAIGVQK